MTNRLTAPGVARLPEWRMSANGKKKTLGGRWNMQRVEEVLVESASKKFTMDDLARLVYGSTSEYFRTAVRKHVPSQRNFMMAKLNPLVTYYGERGRIMAIKLYDSSSLEDKDQLNHELLRLRSRNEITVDRYNTLREVLSLPPPPAHAP